MVRHALTYTGEAWLCQREGLGSPSVAGLYESPDTIGFKLNWESLLQSKGLAINGHNPVDRSQAQPPAPKSVPEGHPIIAQRFNVGETTLKK